MTLRIRYKSNASMIELHLATGYIRKVKCSTSSTQTHQSEKKLSKKQLVETINYPTIVKLTLLSSR